MADCVLFWTIYMGLRLITRDIINIKDNKHLK